MHRKKSEREAGVSLWTVSRLTQEAPALQPAGNHRTLEMRERLEKEAVRITYLR